MGKHGRYKRVEPQRVYTFAPTLISRSSALIGTHSLIVSLFDVSRALGNDFCSKERERKREEKEKKRKTKRRKGEEYKEGRDGGSFPHASVSPLFVRRLTSGNSCELVPATPSRDDPSME